MAVSTPVLLAMTQALLQRPPGGSYRDFGALLHPHVPFDRLTLCAVEESGLRVLHALAGEWGISDAVGRLVPFDGSLAGQVLRGQRWLSLPDLGALLLEGAQAEDAVRAHRAGMQAGLLFPLSVSADGPPVGVCLLWSRSPDAFHGGHQALLRDLQPALSAALRNDLLYVAAERRSLELGALERLARSTRASLDLEQVIPACLDAALSILGLSAGGLLLLRDESLELVMARNLPGSPAGPPGPAERGQGAAGPPMVIDRATAPDSPLWQAVRSRRPVLCPNIASDCPLRSVLPPGGGERRVWLLVIPLLAGEVPRGVVFSCGLDTFPASPEELERLGTIGLWIGSAIADAERHAAARELASANVFYRGLVTHLHDAVIATDASGRIEEWTGGAEALTGWSRGEVLGRDLLTLLYGEGAPAREMRRAIEEQLRRGSIFRGESLIRRKDGRQALWESVVARIEMPGGRPDGWVGVHRDVGEARQRLEQRRKQQHLESLSSLAGGLAHDFNNTLGAVMLTALLLREAAQKHLGGEGAPVAPGQLAADMDVVIDAARRGAALAGQLLAFSRGAPLHLQPLDVNDALRQALASSADVKRLQIVTALDPALPQALGDREQIVRALSNLLRNAEEAMPGGGVLRVETRVFERREGAAAGGDAAPEGLPAGRYVRVLIHDEGPGLDPAVQARLFEPFVTTKKNAAGLGLAVAFGVVRAHGGAITVDTTGARGTTFVIDLPLGPPQAQARPAEAPQPAPAAASRILVVDDEPVLVRIAARILRRAGYTVDTAGNGAEALAHYGGPGAYDLVLLDATMPGMSGREVLEELRRRDPGVRVLMMSGYSIDGGPAQLLGVGARGFLPKPFTPQDLLQAARSAMED